MTDVYNFPVTARAGSVLDLYSDLKIVLGLALVNVAVTQGESRWY